MTTPNEIGDHDAALAFLMSRIDYERAANVPYRRREFHLDRMRELLARLGNPHAKLKVVHIAGTKGKGSTAAMIAAMLTSGGYRTGLYTSPHLDRVEERLMIDGHPCSRERFVDLLNRIRPVVESLEATGGSRLTSAVGGLGTSTEKRPVGLAGPTYFEITTAMAFLHFAEREIDIAVVEVGLGGRLDSTNVVQPLVSVITSISFDHMKQLGSTLDAIAREKAGIIKPGVPVVSGVMADEPRRAIDEIRRKNNASMCQLGVDFDYVYRPPHELERTAGAGEIDFRLERDGDGIRYANLELSLLGRHQAANAAVALATIDELRRQGWNVPEQAIRRGLADTRCPARVEVVSRRPTIVIDTAHNLASVRSLVETLDESFSVRRRLLLFAATQEKQVREMLEILLPRFDRVILTRYWNNPRGLPLEHLAGLAADISPTPQEIFPTPREAWRRVRELTTSDHLVCVTGSFFLAAEIRNAIAAEGHSRACGN
ncbi:MAG: bifunctional folylpolyglutamate synthase/dihydrofolate synthase [Acidobacteria bacterium]|nr:MAG: bifunctional folylpolyglutamate synthase/dihydrofolate synthase [Acidobacteriota bacterium]